MDLAVIIVTWNNREIILDALRSLYDDLADSGLEARVIVVDSASSDDTLGVVRANFPQVEVIASQENLGFGKANNLGIKTLGADLPLAVYFLNPDTLSQKGATRKLFDALMADKTLGLVGARLTYGDGSFQHSCFSFPGLRQLWVEFFPTAGRLIEGRFNGRYPRSLYAGNQPFDVDFMLGATMMLRREVIQQTEGFDPHFFMYGEEVDWQWRIRKAGWRILCVPQAHVVHLVGQSTGQAKARSVLNLWESRLYLFKKHYPAWKLAIAKQMIRLGMGRKIRQTNDASIIEAYRQVQDMARQ
jgi:N-acetylglucosaminyl-diphospho-decaprenol L-rhamnosyltransferase